MCTNIFQEVVNNYNRNGSNVFACLVDASKAFDRINYSKLFQTILKRNLPGTIIRLLFDSYTRQRSFVKWGQEFSNVIYMHDGVKQGGVLSATLFCIYMDELLSRLERSGIGCYIGNNYYGNISYADDLKLLCPSINGLQKMLDICDIFSKEYFVTCNAHKTIAICYGKTSGNPKRSLHLNGSSIRWETSVKYLGNMHCSSMSDCNDVTYKNHIYISSVNKLNCHFALLPVPRKQNYCRHIVLLGMEVKIGSSILKLCVASIPSGTRLFEELSVFQLAQEADCSHTRLTMSLSLHKLSTDGSSFINACYPMRMRRCHT